MRFGIIGCGTIAEKTYLPLFRELSGRLTCLVDTDESRALTLGKQINYSYAGKDLGKCFEHVDAVVVAVPNFLHYPIAKSCLEAGKHVLCEKPVATKSEHCIELISLAKEKSLVFSVAHVRRFHPAVTKIREFILSDIYGKLNYFDFREGKTFDWPTVSGYLFDKQKSGGGVLMDIGTHLLDLLFWWIGNDILDFAYTDDCLGGIEACAKIHINFHAGFSGNVKLSRLSNLKNSYTFHFEKARLQWNPFTPRKIYIRENNRKTRALSFRHGNPMKLMLFDFMKSVENKQTPSVTGADALKSLLFVERCYATRKLLPMSWLKGRDTD